MVEVASDEGTRRRLPSWMLGVSAADQVRKSDNGDKNDTVKVEGLVTSGSRAKRKPGKADLPVEKEAFVVSSDELSKPAKRRKRKFNGQDAECDAAIALKKKKSNAERREVQESSRGGNMKAEGIGCGGSKDIEFPSTIDDGSKFTVNAETAVQKKKNNRGNRKAWGSTLDEKVKIVGIGCEGSKDFGIPSSVDDDDELTVEDLINIAKEYVKADKDVGRPKCANLGCELERQFPATASHRNESEGCLNASNSTQRSPTYEAASNNMTVCLANEHSSINTSRTGDPVQDMLDLYLGHLLNKPVEEQRTESITKDVAVASDLEKQSFNDIQEERVPTLKKKSTLRDKEFHSLAHCIAGGCSSVATSFIFTPNEHIKQQMQFYNYESFKQMILTSSGTQPRTLQTLVCGGLGGSTAAVLTTPFGVVKTRLQPSEPITNASVYL